MPMSPRLLRPARTGFNPRSISGLALWLDAADSGTLFQDAAATIPATATNDPVGAWLDKSGSARHATSSTPSQRPAVSATTQNSRRLLALDGSDDRFSIAFPVTQHDPVSMFVVARRGAGTWGAGGAGGYGSILNSSGGTSAGPQLRVDTGNIEVLGGSNVSRVAGANVGVSACSIITATVTNRDTALYIEGALVDSDTGAGAISSAGTRTAIGEWNPATGGGGPLQGFLAEMLVYRAALTTAERQRIERYLATKWGITLAPQVSNADAQGWVNRVYANGGTVSQATADAVNTFCNSIDAAGIRDRFYRLSLMTGNNLEAALVPLYRSTSPGGVVLGLPTDDNVGFVSGDYTLTGSLNNATGNKYLRLNARPFSTLLPSGNDRQSGHIAVSCTGVNVSPSATSPIIGIQTSVSGESYHINARYSGSQFIFWGTRAISWTPAATSGRMNLINTRSAGRNSVYENGVEGVGSTGASTTPDADARFAVYASGSVTGTDSVANSFTGRIYAYSVGAGLSSEQAAAYNTHLTTFLDAIGRTA